MTRRHAAQITARITRTRSTVCYAELSGSESDPADEGSDSGPEQLTPQFEIATRRQSAFKRKFAARNRADSEASDIGRTLKRHKAPKLVRSNLTRGNAVDFPETLTVIPPWQTLPYHIFLQIFRFASYPLFNERFDPLPSQRWLLAVARICRNFAEPALTVLYSSPPLVPMGQAHLLVELLKSNPSGMAFKYRRKVRSLLIDVYKVAAFSLPGFGHLDLHGLIKDLPRLLDLEFYHQMDMPPYRELDATIKWTYPESVFEALEHVDPGADYNQGDKTSICNLRSWRWSSRLAGKKWPIGKLVEVHLRPSFKHLRKIAFVNYQIPTFKEGEEDPMHENLLAESLKVLINLEHLIFESSTLVNSKLLPLLPMNLRSLELINCWEVVSEDLAEFLLSRGQNLRSLRLNHCQSLNLAFLPVLGIGCPNLELLHMDMKYFNIHSTYHDSEPIYDHLLLPDQIPVWPRTLRAIELTHLRKWEREAAEMFFSSLLNTASSFSYLRRLSIQIILNIGWRDRASFRDKWVGSLSRVFKRVSKPPMPTNTLHSAITDPGMLEVTSEISRAHALMETTPPRRSARMTTRALSTGKYAESSSSETEESTPKINFEPRLHNAHTLRRRLSRELSILRASGGVDVSSLMSSPPETPGNGSDFDSMKEKTKKAVQGMCDSVEVRIDNLRPAENQVTEADFLDEEVSGDEDWDSEGDEGCWAFGATCG